MSVLAFHNLPCGHRMVNYSGKSDTEECFRGHGETHKHPDSTTSKKFFKNRYIIQIRIEKLIVDFNQEIENEIKTFLILLKFAALKMILW